MGVNCVANGRVQMKTEKQKNQHGNMEPWRIEICHNASPCGAVMRLCSAVSVCHVRPMPPGPCQQKPPLCHGSHQTHMALSARVRVEGSQGRGKRHGGGHGGGRHGRSSAARPPPPVRPAAARHHSGWSRPPSRSEARVSSSTAASLSTSSPDRSDCVARYALAIAPSRMAPACMDEPAS